MRRRDSSAICAFKSGLFQEDFFVNESTLIPRVETEDLVEWILHDNPGADAEFLDIGTGSGAIGLTLKAEKPLWKGMLSDVSSEALEVAKKNAKRLKLKAEFKLSDVFDAIDGKFDIIVSNPPYIAESEKSTWIRACWNMNPRWHCLLKTMVLRFIKKFVAS